MTDPKCRVCKRDSSMKNKALKTVAVAATGPIFLRLDHNTSIFAPMGAKKCMWALIGLACIAALMLLATVFFRERATFCDMAYALVFNIILRKPSWYFVRVGAIVPQFFTLAAVYLRASLHTVMIVHSLSWLICYLIIYLLAVRYSRTRLLYLTIPVNLLLLVNQVFFWPIAELQQGIVLLCLYAVVLYEGLWEHLPAAVRWVLHLAVLVWVQFLHPLVLFPVLFLLAYYYIGRRGLLSLQALGHFFVAACAFGLRYLASRRDPYETSKLNVFSALRTELPHFWQLETVHSFVQRLSSDYLCYILLLVACVAWLAVHRRYLSAGLVLGLSAAYWALVMVVAGPQQTAYMENMLLFLGFILSLVIVADILPRIPFRIGVGVFVIIALLRLASIGTAGRLYTERLRVYDPYLRYAAQKNLLGVWVPDTAVDQKKLMVSWAACYETMLLTSLRSPDSCRIVHIDQDFSGIAWARLADTTLITKYWSWNQSDLPHRYFRLSGRHYEIVTERR